MDFILEGSNSMPLRLTIKPKSLLDRTPNAHLTGLSLRLYFLNLSEKKIQITQMVNLHSSLNDDIIDIYLNFFIYHVMEYGSHSSHVGCPCIFRPNGMTL